VENRILILAPRGRDADVVAEVLKKDERICVACGSGAALAAELEHGAGTALIAEEALTGDRGNSLFAWLARQPTWSDFPVILLSLRHTPRHTPRQTSQQAQPHLGEHAPELAQRHTQKVQTGQAAQPGALPPVDDLGPRDGPALNLLERLGNVIVLERPLNAETLRRAVTSALRARLRQFEARRQFAERAAAEERLHLAIAAGRLGSWELDLGTGELRTTEAYRRVYGHTGDSLAYQQVLEAIHPADRQMHRQAVDRAIADNTDLNVEYRVIWPDGSTHWIQARGRPSQIRESVGAEQRDAALRVIGVSLDVTDRHAANDKILASQSALERLNDTLESRIAERTMELASANDRLMKEIHEREKVQAVLAQAQKMEALGRLTGGIAHDFNNLLNVIMGNAELIARVSTDERVRAMAQTAKRATERGAKLTGQLLTFSRSSNLDLKTVDLVSLVHGMRDMLIVSLGARVRLGTESALDEAWTSVDINQLELAILNLAINARDAMPDGGTLTVRVTQRPAPDETLAPGRYAVIAVRDTGTGIAADILPRVFDPFFTTKPVGKGTGLGLSQVYGIARQAGGTARIQSEPGSGTTVEIWLPARDKLPVERADALEVEEHADGQGRILVIEDDVDVRTFVVECLEMLGYAVTEAPHGKAGLERLPIDLPDVMMVDFAMPGMNGLEVISEARRSRPHLPVILATGYADVEVAAAALDDFAVLRKPFQIGELARVVKAALTRAQT
jgi:PAS domain S-box-containing protein